jgi:hypothetical protein
MHVGDHSIANNDEDMPDEFKLMRLVSVKNRYDHTLMYYSLISSCNAKKCILLFVFESETCCSLKDEPKI